MKVPAAISENSVTTIFADITREGTHISNTNKMYPVILKSRMLKNVNADLFIFCEKFNSLIFLTFIKFHDFL